MSSKGSVSVWIQRLQEGEEAALAPLHQRYWSFLVNLARRRLGSAPRRACDEEDVAQQVLWQFCRSIREGKLPEVRNRQELLALLSHITACQTANQIKHELGVQKRGAGQVQGESVFALGQDPSDGSSRGLDQTEAPGLSPLERSLLNDCYQHYVLALPEHLRQFAELHLAGLTYREIAERMNCTERTVDRKMSLIQANWRRQAEADLSRDIQ
jgi:DNA-directed RNA polymerase specialized sigma24 family protein